MGDDELPRLPQSEMTDRLMGLKIGSSVFIENLQKYLSPIAVGVRSHVIADMKQSYQDGRTFCPKKPLEPGKEPYDKLLSDAHDLGHKTAQFVSDFSPLDEEPLPSGLDTLLESYSEKP